MWLEHKQATVSLSRNMAQNNYAIIFPGTCEIVNSINPNIIKASFISCSIFNLKYI